MFTPKLKIRAKYYYAIGIALFLLGITLMLLPHALHQEGELWRSVGEVGTFLALIVSLHYIYEILIKNDDRDFWTNELETHLRTHFADLQKIMLLKRASIYVGPEVAYAAVTNAVLNRNVAKRGEKKLSMGALYDHSGTGRQRPPEFKMHDAFDAQMYECIHSTGPDQWHVRELYNITNEERLNRVLGRIESAGDCSGYEVRAFCLENAIPQLTPLIVDDEDLFIGWDDSIYYGVQGVFHVRGQKFAEGAEQYFDSLWNDKRVFNLRSGLSKNADEIETLRKKITKLQAKRSKSDHPRATPA